MKLFSYSLKDGIGEALAIAESEEQLRAMLDETGFEGCELDYVEEISLNEPCLIRNNGRIEIIAPHQKSS